MSSALAPLPPRAALAIFEYLSPSESRSLALSCRSFAAASRARPRSTIPSAAVLSMAMKGLPMLCDLCVGSPAGSSLSSILLAVFAHCTAIRSLDVSMSGSAASASQLPVRDEDPLCAAFASCAHLRVLRVRFARFAVAGCILRHCPPSLEEFSLLACSRSAQIGDGEGCGRLKTIQMSACGGIDSLPNLLRAATSLTKLNISSTIAGNREAAIIASACGPRLRTLVAVNTFITAEGFVDIASRCPLVALECGARPRPLRLLLSSPLHMLSLRGSLRALSLAATSLSMDSLRIIACLLPRLVYLDISFNAFTLAADAARDAGARGDSARPALRELTRLRCICIIGMSCPSASFLASHAAQSCGPSLRIIVCDEQATRGWASVAPSYPRCVLRIDHVPRMDALFAE